MTAIGNAIGIPWKRSGNSWSNYWETQTNFYGRGLSGLTIPDDYNNDSNILLPYLYKPDGDEYLGRTDAGAALSIGATDFTFAMWVKGEGLNNPLATDILGGKMDSNYQASGGYGFDANGVTGKYRAYLRTDSFFILNESEVTALDSQWHFLLMEVDQTAKALRFWIDNSKIGDDVIYTDTFGSPTRPFCIGCATVWATQAMGVNISKASYSDTYIYHKKLTSTEKTTLFNRGIVTGATAHWVFDHLKTWVEDSSGNHYYLGQGANLSETANILYSAYGSRQGLTLGYSLYQKVGVRDIYTVYKDDGTALTPDQGDATYILSKDFAGNTSYHNFYDSFIVFTGDQWDRSDVTIYNATARTGYYDAASPKKWHITELNEFILRTYFNTGYESTCFTKITNDGTFDTRLDEIFSFTTNLTAGQLLTIQTHINKVPTISTISELENATWERHPSKAVTINYNPIIQSASEVWKTDTVYYPKLMVDPSDSTKILCFYGGMEDYNVKSSWGLATSLLTNPFKFTDSASNPIFIGNLDQDPPTWEGPVAMPACVLWNPDDNKFWMYYAAYEDPQDPNYISRTALATSPDGITWTRYASNPVLAPSGDENSVGDCSAVLREGNNWYMYYNWREAGNILPGIRVATSSDGLSWTKTGVTLISRNATYAKTYIEGIQVFKFDNKYCLFYGSYNADTDEWTSSLAYSDNPTSGFVNSSNNPLVGKSSGGWDRSFSATFELKLINGKWMFMYQSTSDLVNYGDSPYHMGIGQLFKSA